MIVRSLACALLVAVGACGEPDAPPPPRVRSPIAVEPERDPSTVIRPPVAQPRTEPSEASHPAAPRIVAAPEQDHEYANDEPVEARRAVYRVTMSVPPGLGEAPPTLPRPASELVIDVSHDRLRARFEGAGWPVPDGSEIRYRRDTHAIYVFDADGGRPLGSGQLPLWFEGSPRLRTPPLVAVRRLPQDASGTPGELVCWFLAEWARVDPETIVHRCERGGTPSWFRLGPFRAERMADVPEEVPRAHLRADDVDPPPIPRRRTDPIFVSSTLLSRVEGRRRRPDDPEGAPGVTEGLVVRNAGDARLVVTLGGLPVAWIEPGAEERLLGVRPGLHAFGAMRPLGVAIWHARPVVVPGAVTIRY